MAVHRIHVIQSKVRRFLQRIAINLCLWSKVQTCWISWTGKGHKHNRCLNPNGRDCHFCCCPGHSRVLFGLVQKYEEKEESNVIMWTNLERLDMAHIKLEAALETWEKWQITDASLLLWRRKLKCAAQECDELFLCCLGARSRLACHWNKFTLVCILASIC